MTGSGRALCALAVALAGWMASPIVAWGETAAAMIVPEHPDRICVGDTATLTWTPPGGVDGITGYEITRQNYSPFGPETTRTVVGREQTNLGFTVSFFTNTFLVRTVTAAGVTYEPFASATIFGNQAPQPMYWDHRVDASDVGDGTARVGFAWAGPVQVSTTGGGLPVTVRVTADPGGASIEIPTGGSHAVTTTFTGLTNGVRYTFSGVTSNACGSSGASTSAVYVPGVRPSWAQASPPLRVKKNRDYVSRFTAAGDPAPTYQLVGAPAWLAVAPDGTVSGDPPKGTSSFSYSIAADNRVGIEYPGLQPPIVQGPFTVTVGKGMQY